MPPQTLANRVAILEQKVESLEGLPDRVASLGLQISQFREEVRLAFSAVHGEIRAGDEETRRQMRVLHGDVTSRIALLNEHFNSLTPSGRADIRRTKTKTRSSKR